MDVDIDLIGADSEKETGENLSVEEKNKQEEVEEMSITLEKIEKDNPELLASIKESMREEIKTEMEAEFNKEKDELKSQINEVDKKNLRLEKRELLRTEEENSIKAKLILNGKLSKSDVPEHLYEKVHNMFKLSEFTKENEDGFGILDEEKFSEAVDKEIPSWEVNDTGSSVGGVGFTKKETEENEDDETETTQLSNDLLKLAGQDVE